MSEFLPAGRLPARQLDCRNKSNMKLGYIRQPEWQCPSLQLWQVSNVVPTATALRFATRTVPVSPQC